MSEYLRASLAREAERIAAPEPRTDLVIRRARTFRRRHHAIRLIAGVGALSLVAAVLGVLQLDNPRGASVLAQVRFEQASAAPAYATYGAFAIGGTVYIGNHQVRFKDKIKSIYYTSEGVLVRRGHKAYLDEPGASLYTLIRPDGTARNVALHMGDRVPATDPRSPVIAYLEPTGDRWSFVVVDLRDNKEIARKTVDGSFTWGGWEAPPATTSGTRVWGLFDEGWREYDWKDNSTRLIPGTSGAGFEAAHGRYVSTLGDRSPTLTVTDFVSGKVVRTITKPEGYPTFSPDGRFMRISGPLVYSQAGKLLSAPAASFLNLRTGHAVKIAAHAVYGWTPEGNTLSVDPTRNRIAVCDPSTGSCDQIHLMMRSGPIKLGGHSYES